MGIDALPDWLMQSTLSVEGLHTSVSSQINLKEKLVSFKISWSGWLSNATSPAALAIKESIRKRAKQIKIQKEESARKDGWEVVNGNLDKKKRNLSPAQDHKNQQEEDTAILAG